MTVLRPLLAALALVLAAACVLGGLLAQGGRWNVRLDALTHLAPLYAAGALLAVVMALAGSPALRPAALALSLLGLALAAILMAPEFLRATGPVAGRDAAGQIKIIQFNMWRDNSQLPQVVDWINAQHPDLVFMEETTPAVRNLMQARGWHVAGYATTVMIFTRERYLYMNRPLAGPDEPLNWVNATYASANGPMELVVTHLSWPTTPLQSAQSLELRQVLSGLPHERMILAGDFNSTPWSFLRRRDDTALGLTRRDRAVATWPARTPGPRGRDVPFPILPIDHLYAGPGWATVNVARGPRLGSDHYPLIVTLAPVSPAPGSRP